MIYDKFLIFDLDGTLIDTNTGINKALNETLKKLRFKKTFTCLETKKMIGNGAKVLFKRALNREFSIKEYNLFLENYEKYQYTSKLYPYVKKTLTELKKRGYLLFIYSNKPHELLINLVNDKFKYNLDLFSEIEGENIKLYPKKPNPDYLNLLMKKYKIISTNGYYIGDSKVDAILAKNANLSSIIVSYGYGIKSEINVNKNYKDYKIDYKIKKFNELLNILK